MSDTTDKELAAKPHKTTVTGNELEAERQAHAQTRSREVLANHMLYRAARRAKAWKQAAKNWRRKESAVLLWRERAAHEETRKGLEFKIYSLESEWQSEANTLCADLMEARRERDEARASLKSLASCLVDTNTKTSVETVAALVAERDALAVELEQQRHANALMAPAVAERDALAERVEELEAVTRRLPPPMDVYVLPLAIHDMIRDLQDEACTLEKRAERAEHQAEKLQGYLDKEVTARNEFFQRARSAESALQEARAKALEEAAKVADRVAAEWIEDSNTSATRQDFNRAVVGIHSRDAAQEIALTVRALAATKAEGE